MGPWSTHLQSPGAGHYQPCKKGQYISQEAHKEEMKARIASDGADRQSIQDELKLCIDLLDPASHPPTIANIVSGQVADDTVNVKGALTIGTKQIQEFEKGWPEGSGVRSQRK